jgi:Tfp pilus assembly protein PilO
MNKHMVKILGFMVAALITLAIGGWAVQQYYSYQETKKLWSYKTTELANQKAEIAEIEQSLKAYEEEQLEFSKLLFQERDIPAFLDEISKFAKESEVVLADMKTQKFVQVEVPKDLSDTRLGKPREGNYTAEQLEQLEETRIWTLAAMPIQIKVLGNFASLVKFLDQLQDYTQLLNISDIKISYTMNYPTLECNFTLKIYSIKTLEELKLR